MTILLTGGTGKTSTRLATILQNHNPPISYILTSRGGALPSVTSPANQFIKFDFADPDTYACPFNYQSVVYPEDTVNAIYLIVPETNNPSEHMLKFINLAVNKYGVERFVLLTGTTASMEGGYIAPVWTRLEELKQQGKGTYAVLQATWFMENFSEWQHFTSIKDERKIYTSCGDGKIPFVAAEDISAVAAYALTTPRLERSQFSVRGPELLTYDQVAEKFSQVLGRQITHVRLSAEDNTKRLTQLGLRTHMAQFLPSLEIASAKGSEASISEGAVELATGKKGMSLEVWLGMHRHAWD